MFFKELLQMLAQWNWAQAKEPDSLPAQESVASPKPGATNEAKMRQEGQIHIERITSNANNLQSVQDYVVFDTETTGLDGNTDKIIEIALLKVSEGRIIDEFCVLVNPERHISASASSVNHIFDKDVQNAPTYDRVAPIVAKFLSNCYLIGHNVDFDLSFMPGLMEFVHLENDITWKCIDTCSLARSAFPGAPNYKLQTLIRYLNLNTYDAHRARADAVATMQLFEKCREALTKVEPLRATTSHESKEKYFSSLNVKPSELVPSQEPDPSHPLFGKNLVFTGDLSIPRKEAYQKAVDCGAIIKTTVSKKVDYLIIGAQDLSVVGSDGLSSKQEKALQMNATGKAHIEFINEQQFIYLVEANSHATVSGAV